MAVIDAQMAMLLCWPNEDSHSRCYLVSFKMYFECLSELNLLLLKRCSFLATEMSGVKLLGISVTLHRHSLEQFTCSIL